MIGMHSKSKNATTFLAGVSSQRKSFPSDQDPINISEKAGKLYFFCTRCAGKCLKIRRQKKKYLKIISSAGKSSRARGRGSRARGGEADAHRHWPRAAQTLRHDLEPGRTSQCFVNFALSKSNAACCKSDQWTQ